MRVTLEKAFPVVLGLFVTMLFLATGCVSSENATTPDERQAGTLTEDEIRDTRSGRLEDVLQGRVAGVRVIEEGQGFRVEIRGRSSFQGSSDPLYVLDGMPLEVGAGGLVHINPRDVSSIRVLKSANETVLYGVRGANGVILIETRRPSKSQDS